MFNVVDNAKQFSKVVVLIDILCGSVQEFLLICILPTVGLFILIFNFRHFGGYMVVSQCDVNVHFVLHKKFV